MKHFFLTVGICFFMGIAARSFSLGTHYEQLVSNALYMIHDLEIALDLLMIENRDDQGAYLEFSSILAQVIGRIKILNIVLQKDFLFDSVKSDLPFWHYIYDKTVAFEQRLGEIEKHVIIDITGKILLKWRMRLDSVIKQLNTQMLVQTP